MGCNRPTVTAHLVAHVFDADPAADGQVRVPEERARTLVWMERGWRAWGGEYMHPTHPNHTMTNGHTVQIFAPYLILTRKAWIP